MYIKLLQRVNINLWSSIIIVLLLISVLGCDHSVKGAQTPEEVAKIAFKALQNKNFEMFKILLPTGKELDLLVPLVAELPNEGPVPVGETPSKKTQESVEKEIEDWLRKKGGVAELHKAMVQNNIECFNKALNVAGKLFDVEKAMFSGVEKCRVKIITGKEGPFKIFNGQEGTGDVIFWVEANEKWYRFRLDGFCFKLGDNWKMYGSLLFRNNGSNKRPIEIADEPSTPSALLEKAKQSISKNDYEMFMDCYDYTTMRRLEDMNKPMFIFATQVRGEIENGKYPKLYRWVVANILPIPYSYLCDDSVVGGIVKNDGKLNLKIFTRRYDEYEVQVEQIEKGKWIFNLPEDISKIEYTEEDIDRVKGMMEGYTNVINSMQAILIKESRDFDDNCDSEYMIRNMTKYLKKR